MSRTTATALALATLLATSAAAEEARVHGRLFVYPTKGQTQAQLEQDRYECHVWARQQSGFDPSNAPAAPTATTATRVPVADNPAAGAAAKGTLAGAVVGGVLGAQGHDALGGAVLGAAVGGLAGGTIETDGQRKIEREARDAARQLGTARVAADDAAAQRRGDYRRALGACLEARGYTAR
jgi:hypothetical protein